MAPSEHNEAGMPGQTFVPQRVIVYALAAVGLLVVLWALMAGDERNLWTDPVSMWVPAISLLTP